MGLLNLQLSRFGTKHPYEGAVSKRIQYKRPSHSFGLFVSKEFPYSEKCLFSLTRSATYIINPYKVGLFWRFLWLGGRGADSAPTS